MLTAADIQLPLRQFDLIVNKNTSALTDQSHLSSFGSHNPLPGDKKVSTYGENRFQTVGSDKGRFASLAIATMPSCKSVLPFCKLRHNGL
jgi:hypothetical protein